MSLDSGFTLKLLKKKMSRKQKKKCDAKVAARIKQSGAQFPEDDCSNSSSSDSWVIILYPVTVESGSRFLGGFVIFRG